MGSAVGPASIFSKFEKLIISDLVASGTIKFYGRYVDDTHVLVVLVRPPAISHAFNKFNSFGKNLKFSHIL